MASGSASRMKDISVIANAGPKTNGSRFFITHVATRWFNGKHTVFGQVRQGQETVDAVQQGDELIAVTITEQHVARESGG